MKFRGFFFVFESFNDKIVPFTSNRNETQKGNRVNGRLTFSP